jgi:hypothetical protein
MPRLPDRFDLWVRRARESTDPERQLDYVLGALVALPEWFFLDIGMPNDPQPGFSEVEGVRYLLVFSDSQRVLEIAEQIHIDENETPVITIPSATALPWCVQERPMQCEGLLLNAGADAAAIPLEHVAAFASAWQGRGGLQAAGFWIPNLTTEEEDFWQENGL